MKTDWASAHLACTVKVQLPHRPDAAPRCFPYQFVQGFFG